VRSKTRVALMVLTVLIGLSMSVRVSAQGAKDRKADSHRYRFVDVGTFGGPVSYLANDSSGGGSAAGVLNRQGAVVSAADTSIPDPNYPNACLVCPFPADPLIFHALKWHDGVLTDLGALPGVNSSFANWISRNGLVAGFSENGAIDPLLGLPEIEAVLWKNSEIINLGTIEGGYESNAFAVNDRGQVAGVFLNTIPDPFSPFGLQVRAFLWQNGVMEDLGTLGGPEASAYFMNERGQVVGTSLINSIPNSVTGIPTLDPFIWADGKMMDLGTLGGTIGIPNALSNRGQVVGLSNVAGDQSFHPFLWTEAEGMQDLGTFGGSTGQANWINEAGQIVGWATNLGDQALYAFLWRRGMLTKLTPMRGEACSVALGINSKSQVVGLSAKTCTFIAEDRHASLWEDGHVIDLNAFLPSGADLQQLTDAYNINDRGEIVGLGIPPGCDDEFACGRVFVLIPCEDQFNSNGCQGELEKPAAAIQGSRAEAGYSSVNVAGVRLTASKIADRMLQQFGWTHGFKAWPVDKDSRRQPKW
jgi:probable HAF family extracellular repeat protein